MCSKVRRRVERLPSRDVVRMGSYPFNGVLGRSGQHVRYRPLGCGNAGIYVTGVTVAGIVAGFSDPAPRRLA
jgi:hypothetical protein